jgi:hypothetical protein
MTVFAYDLVHKHQTKANDCWYACIQMLRTQRTGTKTKTIGDAALNLRNVPILGRTMRASEDSSVFLNILIQNGLTLVAKRAEYEGFLVNHDDDLVVKALQRLGPIMIGGMYGRLFSKKMGHFIVLSGIDTVRQLFKINDPDKRGPDWRPYFRIKKDYWGLGGDDGCNAIAASPDG